MFENLFGENSLFNPTEWAIVVGFFLIAVIYSLWPKDKE